MEGNCGYFRRLLSFIFTKWSFLSLPKSFPAIFGVDRIPVCPAQAQPALLSMHAISQHAFLSMRGRLMHRNCRLYGRSDVHSLVTSSSNTTCQPLLLAPSLAWPVIICPDSTIAKTMTCVRTKTTILTRCLAVDGTVPIIARCQYSSRDDRVQTRVGTATRTSASPFSHGKHK